jgi:para-nitrobenzyl esterase
MSVEALHKLAWTPAAVIDNYVLREELPAAYRNRRHNDVPLLAGWNAEEGKDLAPEILRTSDFTVDNHRKLMAQMLGYAPSDALLAAYPAITNDQAKASIHQFTNDWWGWRTIHWAGLQAKYGRSKPYVYFFAHRPAAPLTPCEYGCGAGHGAEIPFVFDNIDQDRRPWSKADRELAARLADTWVNFARTGSPSGKGLPDWPAFDGSNASIFRIGGQDRLPDFLLFQRAGKDQ